VGRVLYRGQQLSQKFDAERSETIRQQLKSVNDRWEKVRQMAMERQQQLQFKLDQIQRQHLENISQWVRIIYF
jgi:hypothetical protein